MINKTLSTAGANPLRNRCSICGRKTTALTECRDQRFNKAFEQYFDACNTIDEDGCADHWKLGHDDILLARIKKKLLGDKNG